MKAFVQTEFGSADTLELCEIDRPIPAAGEVVVRVLASSVNPYDWHHMRGEPRIARIMPNGVGFRSPKRSILGADIAGRVEAIGEGVTDFSVGDDVFGLIGGGGFAEYVAVRQQDLVPKPSALTYEQAASLPMAGVTALVGLVDDGQIERGQKVLITGASGGIGTFAVQIARALGAEVTGVCSTRNLDLVRSLGATNVIDYTAEDFTRQPDRFDLVLDLAGGRPVLESRRILKPKGTLVVVGGPAGKWLQPAGHAMSAGILGAFVSQRMVMTATVSTTAHLRSLLGFIERGELTPVIDRTYAFNDTQEAVRYQELGHAAGKVVISAS